MKYLEVIRGLVRPITVITVIGTIAYMAIYLVRTFADANIALMVITGIMTAGGTIIGFLFGERAAKK